LRKEVRLRGEVKTGEVKTDEVKIALDLIRLSVWTSLVVSPDGFVAEV
jgi:hypothetical protein